MRLYLEDPLIENGLLGAAASNVGDAIRRHAFEMAILCPKIEMTRFYGLQHTVVRCNAVERAAGENVSWIAKVRTSLCPGWQRGSEANASEGKVKKSWLHVTFRLCVDQ